MLLPFVFPTVKDEINHATLAYYYFVPENGQVILAVLIYKNGELLLEQRSLDDYFNEFFDNSFDIAKVGDDFLDNNNKNYADPNIVLDYLRFPSKDYIMGFTTVPDLHFNNASEFKTKIRNSQYVENAQLEEIALGYSTFLLNSVSL